jgi:hypothetical protein
MRFLFGLVILILAPLFAGPAHAIDAQLYCWQGPTNPQWAPCSPTNQLQTAASVSATVTGFAPNGNFATLTATGSSASVALPAGAVVVFSNTGTTTVSCTLGIGSATAVASENQIPASSSVAFTVGSNTFGACIDQSGSASNVVVLAGGTGLFTGFGGGGGSGSSAITTWAGGTLGAMANYGTSPGAVLVPGMNAFITNVPTVAQATAANLNATVVGTGTFAVQATLQASATTAIGKVDPNTIATWGLAAASQNVAAPTNGLLGLCQFTTSPATISTTNVSPLQCNNTNSLLVNVTNANANGQATMANSSPVVIASNQSTLPVNTAQVNGVTTLTGTGAVGTGTQRVAVGTDTATIAGSAPGTAGTASANVVTVQGIASMTKLLVTPDSVALPANQSVNVSQVNGVTTQTGTGTSGTGTQRVAVATDSQINLAANVTATACSGTITSGGTAQNAFTAQTTLHGFTVANIDTTEPLWISFTGTAAASGTDSYPLPAATATTFAGFGSFTAPPGFGLNHALSVIAATTSHKFSCTWW